METAFDAFSALGGIAKAIRSLSTDPSLFRLGCVLAHRVVVWFGTSGEDLMYNISEVLKSAGTDSGYASDTI